MLLCSFYLLIMNAATTKYTPPPLSTRGLAEAEAEAVTVAPTTVAVVPHRPSRLVVLVVEGQ
jgi:hypothetical protein